jgi:GMP synthase-like glutamine amidotransferase
MLLIIQNDPEVPAGNFEDTLADHGIPYRIVHPYDGEPIPKPTDFSSIIVLGGAMGVHDTGKYPFLLNIKSFILSSVKEEIPFLGICLGGQLLSHVLGGRVISNSPHGEKGTLKVTLSPDGTRDPLFSGIPGEFVTFQWHNDSFEIPEGGTLLASSPACPGQAFRFGPCAWGTQFHPEVNRAIVDCWARWTDETSHHAEEFLSSFSSSEETYLEVSRKLLGNFLSCEGRTK